MTDITERELWDFPEPDEWDDEEDILLADLGDCLQRLRAIHHARAGIPQELASTVTDWTVAVSEKFFSEGRYQFSGVSLVRPVTQAPHETKSLLEAGWESWLRERATGQRA